MNVQADPLVPTSSQSIGFPTPQQTIPAATCLPAAPLAFRTMGLDRKHLALAALAVFIAWAYLTDWLPSLRWIPHAFLAGALTALLALTYLLLTTSKPLTHHDAPPHHNRRLPLAPAFTAHPTIWEEEKAILSARAEYRRPTIFPHVLTFSRTLDDLLDLILRDYITSWYSSISPRPLFQHEIDRAVRSALVAISARVFELDIVEIGVARLLPLVTAHMREFYDAERTVRGKDLSNAVTESEELDLAVAGKYRGGKLHAVAALVNSDTGGARQRHLRRLVERLLPVVLPENLQSSSAVTVLVREIVACAVLGPVFQLLQDPDTWNQLIVNVGSAMLHDRKQIRKLRAALDQHAPASPKTGKNGRAAVQFPRLRPYDTERQFERFIRAIRHVNTVSDARRFRSEVVSQLRRDSALDNQDAVYLRRLETGKRLLDQKIASFGSGDNSRTKMGLSIQTPATNGESSTRKKQASLRNLLYDASGLSYYMEFMDRKQLMKLVQFFIVVDGFRNPLEGDADEPPPATESDRTDIAQMYEGYLSRPELQASDSALQAVRRYVKTGDKATHQNYVAARQAVLRTQTEVYERMKETSFLEFKKSDLFYKWLALDDNPALTAVQNKQLGSNTSPASPGDKETSPVKMRKPQLAPSNKEPELRRAVLSSTDLRGSSKASTALGEARRSLDDTGKRPSLFEDDVEDERMTQSVSSLRSIESENDEGQQAQDQAHAVDAMQLALDNIVGDDSERNSLLADGANKQSFDSEPARQSVDQGRPPLSTRSSESNKPSIASLGLVGAPSSRGVFVDDLFGDEAQKFAEDERDDSDAATDDDRDHIQEAAPGDLGLSEAIDALNADIERLTAQKNIVDSLSAKAELTNNTAELRILRKSEQSLQREIKRKEMQRQQYTLQESDNSLYGRAAINIQSVMVGREDDGREFALYVIEVRRQAGEQMPAATWAVTRRYSQFHELHKRLRARFAAVGDLEFPRRQTLFTLQKDFLQKRRITLERYLRSLLLVPAICRSRELRAFLSQSAITSTNKANGTQVDARDFVTRIYNSVSDGMEEFLGNIPVLDQLSTAGQNLITAATAQMNGVDVDNRDPASQDPETAAEAEAELNAYETTKELEPFVKPICDLFLETFELAKGNSWLRGRTVVVVLHQLLGGTIERKVRDGAKTALQDESLAGYVKLLRDIMWPEGKMRAASVPRSVSEKARTRKEAGLLLAALLPDLAGSVVGRGNAKAASRKVMALLNNERLK